MCAWLRAPHTPPPGLQPGLHRKTTFCFSASTFRQDSYVKHSAASSTFSSGAIQQTPFRPDSLQSITLYDRHYLPPGASRTANSRRLIFSYQHHNPPPANDLHSGLTGQCIPSLILFSFFFFLFLSHSTQKRKPAKPISFFFLQSQI